MASRTQYELEILLGARKASSFDGNINSAKGGIGSISSTAKKAAAAVTAAFAAVNVTQFVEGAVDVYSGFEQSLANTAAIAGASSTEYNQLQDAARAAGKATSKTAQESADALGYMALAGWDVQQSTSALMPVLELSEATQLDLARTSDLVTDSMGAMKVPISDLAGYLDMVVQANNSANTTAEQAMEAFIRTGGAANALGVELTETATAAGILANNGTKGTQSGTALNAIFSRIATNKNAKEAMADLGISIFDAKGEFVGLQNVLIQTEEALSKLSTKKSTAFMKDISGTQYYSKFKYLLDSVEQGADGAASAWDSLEGKLRDSEGALDQMDEKVMDTMQGSTARLNSAIDDMKISFADSFDTEVVEAMELLTGVFNDASESIQEFSEEHAIEIHQVFEDIVSGVETVEDGVGDAVSFVVENWTLIESALAGGAVAYGLNRLAGSAMHVANAFKAVSAAEDISKLTGLAGTLGSLATPFGAVTAGATVAIAGIAAWKVYSHEAHEQMVEDGLAEHFGDITLSMEQLDEIAKDIVGKRKLTQISAMLESIGKTDEAIKSMSDGLSDVETIQWKMKAGLEITTDDKDTYVASVKKYVEDAQNVVSNQGYTVSVATKLLLGKNSSVESENNAFYAGLDSELNGLQKKLNKKIQKAVENGVNIQTNKPIQNLLSKISEITSSVTDAQNEAALQGIQLKYSGKEMTSDDFKQLMPDISDYEKQAAEGAQEAYETSMATLNVRLKRGDISKKKYNKEKSQLEEGYYQTQAKALADGSQFIINSISDAYGPKVKKAMDILQKDMPSRLQAAMKEGIQPHQLDGVINDVVNESLSDADISDKKQEQIADLFKYGLGDIWSDMDELKERMQDNGMKMPKSLEKSWRSTESLAALSGSVEDAFILLGDTVSDSEESRAYIEALTNLGATGPKAFADAMEDASPLVQAEVKNLMAMIQNDMGGIATLNFEFGASASVSSTANSFVGPPVPQGKKGKKAASGKGGKNGSKKKVYRNARGGIYSSPILTTFAEEGTEAAIPLDGSARGKSLLRQANEIMGLTVVEDATEYPPVPEVTRDVELYQRFSSDSAIKNSSVVSSGAGPKYDFQISYAPVIHISGNADQKEVETALKLGKEDFAKMMDEYLQSKERVSFE